MYPRNLYSPFQLDNYLLIANISIIFQKFILPDNPVYIGKPKTMGTRTSHVSQPTCPN